MMSLRKTRSWNETKSRWDHRINDDLARVIFKFMHIEDRFELSGVCKQFSEYIFEAVDVFEITDSFTHNHEIDIPKVSHCLKSCPNIKEIRLHVQCSFNPEELIQTIVANCRNLEKIPYVIHKTLFECSMVMRESFTRLCAHKVKTVNMGPDPEPEEMLIYPNIQTLRFIEIDKAVQVHKSLVSPKIIDIEILLGEGAGFFVDEFFRRYKDLKALTIYVNNDTNGVVFRRAIQKIRLLRNLETLAVETRETLINPFLIAFNNRVYRPILQCIGSSLKIKKLHCHIVFIDHTISQMNDQFKILEYFKSLKLLSISIKNFADFDLNTVYREITPLNFDAFRKLKHVEYIDLEVTNFNQTCEIQDEFLEYIEVNLPHLKSLKLFLKLRANLMTFVRISQLTKIQEIYLELSSETPANARAILENTLPGKCKYLKRFTIV